MLRLLGVVLLATLAGCFADFPPVSEDGGGDGPMRDGGTDAPQDAGQCELCAVDERCSRGACVPDSRARFVTASRSTSCAIDDAGALWCWGKNASGEAGLGSLRTVREPTQVEPGSLWNSVAIGWAFMGHGCGIQTDETAWCWGRNLLGQLGTGLTDPTEVPVPVASDAGPPYRQISAGVEATCAIRGEGELWCWGSDAREGMPFGPGSTTPRRAGDRTGWQHVELGERYGCALAENKQLECWGINLQGQLGRGTPGGEPEEARPTLAGADAFSVGRSHACAVKEGRVHCWGNNSEGQCGQPVSPSVLPTVVALEGTFLEVAAGQGHTCARRDDGHLFCWGSNDSGQLGLGVDAVSEVPVAPGPSVGNGWVEVDTGNFHTCARTLDDVVYCWGSNASGQIGTANGPEQSEPDAVRLGP